MSSSPLRQLSEHDAEAVAALFVASYGDARQVDAGEVRSWIENEEIEPGWLKVLVEAGEVVGYGDIWIQEDELALDIAAPGRWAAFFDWAEAEARERGLGEVRTIPPAGHELCEIAAARGYRYWRSSFTMEVALADPPTAALPEGFELRRYIGENAETLRAALNETFVQDPFWHEVTPSNFREFYLRSRGFDPALWLLAWHGDELAGFALAYEGQGSDESLGWVGTLGVRVPWRRRGLGEALLRSAFDALHARGFRRAGLGVDAENATGAVALYERAGMHVVRRADNWVLDLG
jgi:ribosomal protein S18 acetylase RimI-like enzyme